MNAAGTAIASLRSSEWVVLGILCLGVFSTALDQTVVVAALPSVMVDLEIPLTDLDRAAWIVTGYLISYTVAMPLAGRLSDVYGRVRMFQAALVVFAIGSLLVAVAPNFHWVVAARVLQAFGGGATVPIGLAMAVAAVAPERRGIALGLVAASAEAGSVLGPLYGGGIISWLGWRWIFWLDIPQSFILIAIMAILPNRSNPEAKMDYSGALILAGALTVLTMGLSQRSIFSGESIVPYFMIAFGVFLVGILIVIERRTAQPLLASFLYSSRAFLSSNITQFLVGVALIIALVAVPVMAATVMEKGPWESALHLVRLTAAISGGGGGGRLHPALDWSETGVHNRPCLHWDGPAVHERLGDEGRGAQADRAPDHGGVRVWAGHSFHRRQRFECGAQPLLGRRGLIGHRSANGGDGVGAGGPVRLGH